MASVFGTLSGVAAARDLVDGWKGGHWNRDPIPGQETWATYYAKYAQVRNGQQKQLANGVRWRLATDRRTEIAIPRIVWMPDSRSRDVANRMLEMVHGGAMLFSSQQQEGFLAYLRIHEQEGPPRFSGISEEDYRRHFRNVRELMPKRVVTQSDVALTYASTRYASLIDLGFMFNDQGNYLPRIIRGVTLDFERRQIFTMDACPKGSFKRPHAIYNPVFRFADLLEICDQASLERFETLVQPIEDGIKVAARNRDPSFKGCRARSIDDEQECRVPDGRRTGGSPHGVLVQRRKQVVPSGVRPKTRSSFISQAGASYEAGATARGLLRLK